MGENIIDRSTANIVGKNKTNNFQNKTGRIGNKTVEKSNDQEFSVYLMKT